MCGFALIQLHDTDSAHQLVTYFQDKWTNDPQFSYWMDYVDPNRNAFIHNPDLSDIETHTKQLIFCNLHWKTTKTMLQKHIQKILKTKRANKINLRATANGYPLGTAVVAFDSVKDAELVQCACDTSDVFDECVFVRFYEDKQPSIELEKAHKTVTFDVEKSESEIDSDGEEIVEMDSSEDSDLDSEEVTDDTDCDEEEDGDSEDSDQSEDDDGEYTKKEKRFPLSNKELEGLWKWSNPNKKCPTGLLSQSRHVGRYKKNWKE
eukprot:253586_1